MGQWYGTTQFLGSILSTANDDNDPSKQILLHVGLHLDRFGEVSVSSCATKILPAGSPKPQESGNKDLHCPARCGHHANCTFIQSQPFHETHTTLISIVLMRKLRPEER